MRGTALVTFLSLSVVTNAFQIRVAKETSCAYGDACWPTSDEWNAFNGSLGGKLIAPKPVAAVCHRELYDEAACSNVRANWEIDEFQTNQPGGYAYGAFSDGIGANNSCSINGDIDSPCSQGQIPVLAVNVSAIDDIVASLLFASTHNLKLRIKNTGHTLTGQSQGTGSFAIYTHNLKDIQFHDNFVLSGSAESVGSAVTYQAGVQFYELYPAADEAGVIVVGGSCDSVGGAGGYFQGGGHSHLTPHIGLGLDNVLEFTLVTVFGEILKVNHYTNPDLWWAVRGGGGGTWGVIYDVTYKTHPKLLNMVAINFQYTVPNTDLYEAALKSWIDLTPTMRDYGMTDISAADRTAGVIFGTIFLPNVTDFQEVDQVLTPLYDFAAANNVSFTTTYNVYDTYWKMVSNEPLATRPGGHEDAVVSAARIVPRSAYANTTALAKFLAALPATYMFETMGGKSTEFSVNSSAINPAWRGPNGALAEYIWYEGWTEAGSADEQLAVREAAVEKLKTLTDIIGSDAVYSNEANPDEDYFPHNFWGSNYDRLLAIKKQYDPKRLLTCNVCVGWDGY